MFELAKEYGYDMKLLDIGGGFPGFDGDTHVPFEILAEGINEALTKYFGDLKDVEFIAEPGRYMAAETQVMAVQVIGKNVVTVDKKT